MSLHGVPQKPPAPTSGTSGPAPVGTVWNLTQASAAAGTITIIVPGPPITITYGATGQTSLGGELIKSQAQLLQEKVDAFDRAMGIVG